MHIWIENQCKGLFLSYYFSKHYLVVFLPRFINDINMTEFTYRNTSMYIYVCMRPWTGSVLLQVIACCPFCAKPLPKLVLTYYQMNPWEQTSVKFNSSLKTCHWFMKICINWECRLRNGGCLCVGVGGVVVKVTRVRCILVDNEWIWLNWMAFIVRNERIPLRSCPVISCTRPGA